MKIHGLVERRRSAERSDLRIGSSLGPMTTRNALALAGLLSAALVVDASARINSAVMRKVHFLGGARHPGSHVIQINPIEQTLDYHRPVTHNKNHRLWNSWMMVVELLLFPILLFSVLLLLPIFSVVDVCQRLSWKLPWMR